MKPEELSDSQYSVWVFIATYMRSHKGVAPSYREIAPNVYYSSESSPHKIVTELEEMGYLHREGSQSRNIRLDKWPEPPPVVGMKLVPVIGDLRAGPLTAIGAYGSGLTNYVYVPEELPRRYPSGAAMHVHGDSMTVKDPKRGMPSIPNDSIVWIDRLVSDPLTQGDIVVAIEGSDSTLKIYMGHKDGKIFLCAANPEYGNLPPIEFNERTIQGKLICVISHEVRDKKEKKV